MANPLTLIAVSLFTGAALVAQGALPAQLVVPVVVVDDKGNPIRDMRPEEFEIKEGGKSLSALRAEIDTRPLAVAVVLDSSAALGASYQSDFVPATMKLLQALPQGTEFTVWTTSDRPKQTVPPGTSLDDAERQLRMIAPFGNNAVVDTIVAASQPFNQLADRRSAVIAITTATMGDMQVDIQAELPRASIRPMYLATEVILTQQDSRVQRALEYLANRTAGLHARVFSTMAVQPQIEKVLRHLDSQYRIAWAPQMDPRQAKLEFKSKRRGTKLLWAQRVSTTW